jgi:hydroxybutyrate-dimer hydrolase
LGTVPGTGDPTELAQATETQLFGTSNGIPPTGGVNVINNASVNGSKLDRVSVSQSTDTQDENLDGALCLRALEMGVDPVTGHKLKGNVNAAHNKVLSGIAQIRASGNLHGLPAIFVTGRNDAILALNHASRAYYGLNQTVEGLASHLRYYEITNAQHLDALNAFAGFDNTLIPLHHYFIKGLDLMFDHLKNNTPLPPSQVVHTIPRGGEPGAAPPITLANLPPINPAPGADSITFVDREVRIPE